MKVQLSCLMHTPSEFGEILSGQGENEKELQMQEQ